MEGQKGNLHYVVLSFGHESYFYREEKTLLNSIAKPSSIPLFPSNKRKNQKYYNRQVCFPNKMDIFIVNWNISFFSAFEKINL
jgi:hypothetical protein